tara:strand:- start:30306 stop:30548 length:243 start_codon:yes stop_codon:yes gene_type:complete
MPTPIRASQHRNLIAQLQRDNRECNTKVSVLLEIIEGQSQIIADAIVVIELHDNEHVDLQVLEVDLEESIAVTNEKLIAL